MTIREFINECNSVVKDDVCLKPSKNADDLRDDAIYALHHHFTMVTGKADIIPVTADGVNIPDTANGKATSFTITKDYSIMISTGESVDVSIIIRFKTSLVGTGKTVKISKTKTVEKMAIADEFVSLDGVDIVYKIPYFAIYDDNTVSTTGFFNPRIIYIPGTELCIDHTIDNVFDDVFANIDKAELESDYNISLSEVLQPKADSDDTIVAEVNSYITQGIAVDWKDAAAQYIRKNYTIVPRRELKLPSVKEFIEECNKVVRDADIGTSDSANDVKEWACEKVVNHFRDFGAYVSSYGDWTWIGIEKTYTITLTTGELFPLTLISYFKTSVKRTGKLIKISKTKSKYEMEASDKFVRFDYIKIKYDMPSYTINTDTNRLEITGYHPEKKYITKDEVDKNKSLDEVINTIDITQFDDEYNNALVNSIIPKVFHKGYDDLRDKLAGCISMENWCITDWDRVLAYVRNNCEIDIKFHGLP